jgi:hypothetical protein
MPSVVWLMNLCFLIAFTDVSEERLAFISKAGDKLVIQVPAFAWFTVLP